MQVSTQDLSPEGLFTLIEAARSLCAMPFPVHTRPIHAARWAAFRALLEDRGMGVSAAAELMDKAQPQVSSFGGSNPTKIIGDDLAQQIEEAFGLDPGTLDKQSSGEGTVNERPGDVPTASQFWQPDVAILTEVEKWLRFEESTAKRKYQAVRRLGRAIALLQLLTAGGGRLTQEQAVALVDAARKKGAERNGRKAKRGDT